MQQIVFIDRLQRCIPQQTPTLLTFLLPLLLLVTAACSRPSLPTWLGGQPAVATPTPIAEPTHLQLWAWPATAAEDAHLQSLVEAFDAQEPTITVETVLPDNYARRLRTLLGTEGAPDLFLIPLQQLPDLVAQGLIAPLPPPLAAESDRYPQLQRATQVDGTPYCVPHHVYTLALFYNRTLFNAAALPYPDETWDWAALQTAATALTNPEANTYGIVLPADGSRWVAFLAQAGGAIVTDDGRAMAINSAAGEQALDFYTGLVLEGIAAPPTAANSRWPGEAFAQGRVAMMLEANWAVPYLQESAPTLDYGVAPLPNGPAGRATVAFATCFALAAKETAAPIALSAAAALIAQLTSTEAQQSWFPVNTAIAPRPSLAAQWRAVHPTLHPFITEMDNAIAWQLPAAFQGWVDQMNEGLRRIFGGFIPPEALLPELEAAGNELLGATRE